MEQVEQAPRRSRMHLTCAAIKHTLRVARMHHGNERASIIIPNCARRRLCRAANRQR